MAKPHEKANQKDKRHQIKLLSLKNERKAEQLNVIEESRKERIVNLLVKDAKVQSLARNRIMRKLATRLQELNRIQAAETKIYRALPKHLEPVERKRARVWSNCGISEQCFKSSFSKCQERSTKRSVRFQLPGISLNDKQDNCNQSETAKNYTSMSKHHNENQLAITENLCLPVL